MLRQKKNKVHCSSVILIEKRTPYKYAVLEDSPVGLILIFFAKRLDKCEICCIFASAKVKFCRRELSGSTRIRANSLFFIRFLCHKAVHTCCRYFHKKIEIFSRYVLFRSNYNKQLFVTISWLHLLVCGLLCQ